MYLLSVGGGASATLAVWLNCDKKGKIIEIVREMDARSSICSQLENNFQNKQINGRPECELTNKPGK